MNEYKVFYDKAYADNPDYEGGSEDADFKFKSLKKEIDRLGRFEKVLDIGCSSGKFLKQYVNAKDKHGFDISNAAVQKAKKNGIHAQMVDIVTDKIPFADETFDAVFMMDTLEHLFDPLQALLNVRKKIKTGGYIIITLPNDIEYILNKINVILGRASVYQYKNNGHIRFFCTRNIRRFLREAGFDIVFIKGYGHLPGKSIFPDALSYGYMSVGRKRKQ